MKLLSLRLLADNGSLLPELCIHGHELGIVLGTAGTPVYSLALWAGHIIIHIFRSISMTRLRLSSFCFVQNRFSGSVFKNIEN